jgi:peptide deformylase
MSVRPIVLLGDPVLRRPASDVERFDDDLRSVVEDMFETMYHADGIGLAAPQIGLSRRILVVDVRGRMENEEDASHEAGPIALVNPRVTRVSEETERASEGCLSIPGLEEIVERPASVVIEGSDPEGRDVRVEATDLYGRALQHEIDHLDGILFLDRVSPLKRRMLLKKWQKSKDEEERKASAGTRL